MLWVVSSGTYDDPRPRGPAYQIQEVAAGQVSTRQAGAQAVPGDPGMI